MDARWIRPLFTVAGIYDAATNELLAEGNTLSINVPDEQLDKSRLGELGWKVVPE